jgi:hypothetical protein
MESETEVTLTDESVELEVVEVVPGSMKVEYSILSLALALAYALLKQALPDFPIDEQTVGAFLLYVLLKLGVEVVNPPVRNLLARFKG